MIVVIVATNVQRQQEHHDLRGERPGQRHGPLSPRQLRGKNSSRNQVISCKEVASRGVHFDKAFLRSPSGLLISRSSSPCLLPLPTPRLLSYPFSFSFVPPVPPPNCLSLLFFFSSCSLRPARHRRRVSLPGTSPHPQAPTSFLSSASPSPFTLPSPASPNLPSPFA